MCAWPSRACSDLPRSVLALRKPDNGSKGQVPYSLPSRASTVTVPAAKGRQATRAGGGGDAEPPPLSNISLGRGWACWHKPVFQAPSLSAQGTWLSSATVTRFRVKESLGGPGREPLTSSHAFISHLLHQEYPLSFQMFADSWGPRTATHTDSSRETPRPAQAARMASEPGQEAAFLFRAATYRGCSHRTPPDTPGHCAEGTPSLGSRHLERSWEGDPSISGAQKSIAKITLKH